MVKLAYVDSSVLVKHYVENEKSSSHASQLIHSHKVYVSSIAQIEVLSALSRKHQLGEVSQEESTTLKKSFLSDCKKMGIVELREEVISEAQDLVFRVSIKTLDSIHLASAIILKQIIETSYPFVTSDKKLAVAAEKEGFEVIRIGL